MQDGPSAERMAADGGLRLKTERDGAGQSVQPALTRQLLRLPSLAPSCDANSRIPAHLVQALVPIKVSASSAITAMPEHLGE
ncbi:hypothetical protein AOG23_18660 [Rhizobium acidisoli]|nr:hypothetical protein AOG23_18660 [Rhizobium acidisoli]